MKCRLFLPPLLALLSTTAFCAEPSADTQWPQWRGPLGNGVAPNAEPPVKWSESENVKWKVAVPGSGTSTPIVWGDKVFSSLPFPSEPSRKQDRRPKCLQHQRPHPHQRPVDDPGAAAADAGKRPPSRISLPSSASTARLARRSGRKSSARLCRTRGIIAITALPRPRRSPTEKCSTPFSTRADSTRWTSRGM